MYLLRRTASRAISATPSKAFLVKPAARTSFTPSLQTRLPVSLFQRRFASDDVTSSKVSEERSTATAQETAGFAQTGSETVPIEENVTPAKSAPEAQQVEPTDAEHAVGAAQLEGVARESARGQRFERRTPRAPRQQDPTVPPSSSIYVGNLYYEVTPDQLQRIFSRFGEVRDVQVVKDNRGMSRGFAYVHFNQVEDATSAIQNLDGQVFEGRNLVCQYHRQRRNDDGNRMQRRTNPPSKTLFIGNMSFEMTDKDLNDLFRDIRNVVDVRVAIDRRTGQPRGFAHADFVDTESAVKAMEVLQGKTFYGRNLRLDYSQGATKERSVGQDRSSSSSEL